MNLLLNKWTVTFNNNRSSIYIFLENFFFLESRKFKSFVEKALSLFFSKFEFTYTMAGITVKDVNAHGTIFFYYKQTRKCTRKNATLNLFFSNRQLIPLTLPSNDMYLQHIKSTCNYLSNLLI